MSNLEQGKAWRAIEEGDAFDDDADDEIQGYIFLCRDGNGGDGREEVSICHSVEEDISVINKFISPITNPDNIVPHVKGECVVTIYDTAERND